MCPDTTSPPYASCVSSFSLAVGNDRWYSDFVSSFSSEPFFPLPFVDYGPSPYALPTQVLKGIYVTWSVFALLIHFSSLRSQVVGERLFFPRLPRCIFWSFSSSKCLLGALSYYQFSFSPVIVATMLCSVLFFLISYALSRVLDLWWLPHFPRLPPPRIEAKLPAVNPLLFSPYSRWPDVLGNSPSPFFFFLGLQYFSSVRHAGGPLRDPMLFPPFPSRNPLSLARRVWRCALSPFFLRFF